MLANPHKALLSKNQAAEDIASIKFFSAGTCKVKLSIMVNGIAVL